MGDCKDKKEIIDIVTEIVVTDCFLI